MSELEYLLLRCSDFIKIWATYKRKLQGLFALNKVDNFLHDLQTQH
jgi:hypothetical protein